MLVGFLGPDGVTAGRWRVVVALGLLELMIGLALTASASVDEEPDMLIVAVVAKADSELVVVRSRNIHGCYLEFLFGTPALANMIPSLRVIIHTFVLFCRNCNKCG